MEMTPGSNLTDAAASSFRMSLYSSSYLACIWISEIRTSMPLFICGDPSCAEWEAAFCAAAFRAAPIDVATCFRVGGAQPETNRQSNMSVALETCLRLFWMCDVIVTPLQRV
jgi:hypothetical protein